MAESELSAGRIDIMAFFHADSNLGSSFLNASTKGFDMLQGRTFPVQSINLVVGNQVYLCPQVTGMPGEKICLTEVIIDPANEDVFEGYDLAALFNKNFAGLQQFGDRITIIDGHYLFPGPVIRSMQ